MNDIQQGAQQPADMTGRVPDTGVRSGAAETGTGSGAAETGTGSRAAETARRLASLDGLPLSEHPDVYEALHGDLHATLSGIDDA